MNAGLILAGGKGERLVGYDKPKQFIESGGKPLVLYCLRIFEQCSDIDLICIVASKEWRGVFNGDYVYAEPGKSRQHSCYNGLLALERYNPAKVIVHDAARPLVTVTDVTSTIRAAASHDGATPALPITDTVYISASGRIIDKTLKRDELFAGQTPECYDFKKYLACHKKLSDDELSKIQGSSEIAVNFGLKIALCKGNPNNFKVTTGADLEKFRAIVEGR